MADSLLWVTGGELQRALSPEVRTFLNISNVENTALSTWAGSSNITTVGTLSSGTVPWSLVSVPSQTAKTFLAAPNGANGVPSFRLIVASDIPTLNQSTTGSAASLTTARTIAISGAVTGTATSFNGTANISIPVTAIDLTHTGLSGVIGVDHLGTGTANATTVLHGNGTWATSTTAAWGSITGTLSAQTDLQNALNAKVGISNAESITGAKTFTATLLVDSTGSSSTLKVLNPGTVEDGGYVEISSPGSVPGIIALYSTTKRRDIQFRSTDVFIAASTNSSATALGLAVDESGNITASGDIYANGTRIMGDGKEMIKFDDAWLRFNPANEFANGIYFGTSAVVRTDGILRVGSTSTAGLEVSTTVFNYQGNNVWHAGIPIKLTGPNTIYSKPSTGSQSPNDVVVYGLAQYKNDGSSVTGAIVISAPTNTSQIMHRFIVRANNHTTANIIYCEVYGYYLSTPAWSNTKKVNLGTLDIQVRLAVDAAGKPCLILGDVGTVWQYPHVFIDGAFSYAGVADAYASDWTTALVTDLSSYTALTATIASSAIDCDIVGNSSTATTLQTARTINGVSFNGSANITVTANTTNTLTFGNGLTNGTFNGSAAVTMSLGTPTTLTASTTNATTATSHTHAITGFLALTGGTLTGTLNVPLIVAGDGNGTESVRVGNDSSLWDVNIANTMGLKGTANASLGYLKFGADPGSLGWDGTYLQYSGAALAFGATTRQMINLWQTSYGLGVQGNTHYARSGGRFSWFKGGVHSDTENAPGAGGSVSMTLDASSILTVSGRIITAGSHFNSSTAAAVLSATGAGQVYLRPNGADNSAAEATLTTGGLFTAPAITSASTFTVASGEAYFASWIRSNTSGTGWYHQVHGGGWYMNDASWVRVYGSKGVLIENAGTTGTNGDLQIYSVSPTIRFYDTDQATAHWLHCNSNQFGFLQSNAYAWSSYRDASNNWVTGGNLTAYASDRRLKTRIVDVPVDIVEHYFKTVRIRRFDWDKEKLDLYKIGFEAKLGEVGAIAQEMLNAFADAVRVNTAHNPIPTKANPNPPKYDILTIDWTKTIPLLTAEVQRLRKRVSELEKRV